MAKREINMDRITEEVTRVATRASKAAFVANEELRQRKERLDKAQAAHDAAKEIAEKQSAANESAQETLVKLGKERIEYVPPNAAPTAESADDAPAESTETDGESPAGEPETAPAPEESDAPAESEPKATGRRGGRSKPVETATV